MIMRGAAPEALAEISAQYADGADPMAVLRDLAEITHWISVIKITPAAAEDPTTPPEERTRGLEMAAALPMRALSRMWQMLLKALEVVTLAPNAMMAAEMAVIRLTHVADLPDPEALIRKLQAGPQPGGPNPSGPHSSGPMGGGAPAGGGGGRGVMHAPGGMRMAPPGPARGPTMSGGAALALAEGDVQVYGSFDAVIDLIRDKRDMKLLFEVESNLRLARYTPGRIEFQPTPDAAPDLAARLGQRLQGWTGARWGVSVVNEGGAATIAETRDSARLQAESEALENPLVKAVLAAFPGARIAEIRTPEAMAAQALTDALPEVEDEWDPFEDG
jgi:DNA polymerase-3 subunit gamma/tau